MVVLKEILVVNTIAVVLMLFLLNYRRKQGKKLHIDDKLYNAMAFITLLGAVVETISFLVDGSAMTGGYSLNYITNSLSFLGTVSIGLLWCLYVDFHVFKSYKRLTERLKYMIIPWAAELAAIVYNLFETGILFEVSSENLYQRGPYVALCYITLVIYFAYSIYIVVRAKRQTLHLYFFPVQYFIAPCFAGVLAQFIFYGITTSWISVAIALIFVQMQADTRDLMTDPLSGLYNRRYLSRIFENGDIVGAKPLYGIMVDINDLKEINDKLGHSRGDEAIKAVGNILSKSMPEGGMPIRYAGDEFVVLLSDVSQECADSVMFNIKKKVDAYNEAESKEFALSISMGQAMFKKGDSKQSFMARMDEEMYGEKKKYHRNQGRR